MEQQLGRLTGALHYQSEKETRGPKHHRYQRDPAVQAPPNTHIDTQLKSCKSRKKNPAHPPSEKKNGAIERYWKMKIDDLTATSTPALLHRVLGPRWNR